MIPLYNIILKLSIILLGKERIMVTEEYDEVKEAFKHYYDVVSQVVSEKGIDVYGTDLRVQTAASLTQAHFTNKLSKSLKDY